MEKRWLLFKKNAIVIRNRLRVIVSMLGSRKLIFLFKIFGQRTFFIVF